MLDLLYPFAHQKPIKKKKAPLESYIHQED